MSAAPASPPAEGDEVMLPSWTGAASARNLASAALRMTYRVRVHGAHHVGTAGSLLLVTPCEGVLAGALLHATAPRPLHVVCNAAMDRALPDKAVTAAGDIRLGGVGAVHAQRRALACLQDERAVALAGTAVSPGYLVAMTGVEVVPVIILGADGRVPTDPPRPRSRIDVFYLPRVPVAVDGPPLQARSRSALAEQVRQAVADAEEQASRRVVEA